MHDSSILYISCVVFLGGSIQGVTGFGFSLIAVPLLVTAVPPHIIIPSMLLLSMLINGLILIESRECLDIKSIVPIIGSGVIGLPVGTVMLRYMNPSSLRILIGILVCGLSTMMILGLRYRTAHKTLAAALAGFVSGALNSSITMSGPPVILFWQNESIAKETFRRTLSLYFLILNLVTIPFYMHAGLLTRHVMFFCLSQAFVVLAGVLVGISISRRIDVIRFNRLTLVLIWIGGVSAIISGLYS